MKVLLWNVKWGEHSRCSSFVNRLASSEPFDLICLTESTTRFFEGWENVLRSRGDYGYNDRGCRQKVSLWSRYGWEEIDWIGSESLPPGRFLSGVTNGIRVVGVCIPWRRAHVSSGRRDRKEWEDHRAFIAGLQSVLARYTAEGTPVCVLGDFNQRVPPTARNVTVYPELEAALGNAFSVGTASVLDVDGELLIDHIATTSEIQFQLVRTISRKRISGQHVSDHPGVIGCLIVESRQTSDIEFESDAEEDVGFPFHKDDVEATEAAIMLARRCLCSPTVTPSQIVGIGRAMYAIQRLPEPTPGVNVEFCARIERGNDQDKHSWGWHVRISPREFRISSGGSVWNSIMGGDSILGFVYEMEAGGYRDENGLISDWVDDIESQLCEPFDVGVDDDSAVKMLGDEGSEA